MDKESYYANIKPLQERIAELEAQVEEYQRNGCCPDPVTGYDCKAINAEQSRRVELEAENTKLRRQYEAQKAFCDESERLRQDLVLRFEEQEIRIRRQQEALRTLDRMIHKAEDNVKVLQRSGRPNDARYESHRLQGLRDALGLFPILESPTPNPELGEE